MNESVGKTAGVSQVETKEGIVSREESKSPTPVLIDNRPVAKAKVAARVAVSEVNYVSCKDGHTYSVQSGIMACVCQFEGCSEFVFSSNKDGTFILKPEF